MRKRTWVGLIAAAMALAPQTVLAKPTPIAVDAAADWVHGESKIGFPAQAVGFARYSVEDITTSQSDVVVTYDDPASKTLTSVYLFRAGLVEVSVWQDRILQQIAAMAGRYGTIDNERRIETRFTPASGGADSGSRIVFPVSGKAATATGSAVMAVDDWLVAVRMTSNQLAPAELDARLASLVATLSLPKARRAPSAAYRIADCADVSLPTKNAKRTSAGTTQSMASALLMGALQAVAHEPGNDEPGVSTSADSMPFCRLAAAGSSHDVYRIDGSKDGYVIAFGDAGVVAEIAPDAAASLLKNSKRFALTLTTSERSRSFRGFKTLPPVTQVLEVLNSEGPVGETGRTPADAGTINIFMPGK